MTDPTSPPPYDHKPAYDWAEGMVQRLISAGDTWAATNPGGFQWAFVEAYMAGRAAALAEREGQQ